MALVGRVNIVIGSMEGRSMTNKSLIAGLASVAATAAVLWAMPAAAYVAHDKWPDPSGVPEPGTLALLMLGLGGIGLRRIRRRPRT